jgi:undecaprenyl-diphosphatase
MLADLDTKLTQWINAPAGASPLLDQFMPIITDAGIPLMIFAIAVQWFLKPDRDHRRHALIATGLSFLLGEALNQFVLHFIHRPRPYDAGVSHLMIEKSADWSFPSDHTTAAVAIVGALAILGYRRQALIFSLAAALICYSRIYVGMHYASDVLGGAVTALIAAAITCKLFRPELKISRLLVSIL